MLAQHLSGGADDEAEHGNAHTSVCDLSFHPCVLFPSAVCAVEGFQQHRLRYEEGWAVVLQRPDYKKKTESDADEQPAGPFLSCSLDASLNTSPPLTRVIYCY